MLEWHGSVSCEVLFKLYTLKQEQIQVVKQKAIELQNESGVPHSAAEPTSLSIDCGYMK